MDLDGWHVGALSRFRADHICRVIAARDITTRKRAELAQIQAHARLAQQASIDGLIGLFNRSHIQAVLDRECLRARRAGHPLCVLLIDVDHFKPLNDYYGHPHGDLCLTLVAPYLSSAPLRPADALGRYGGEEFIVLLPDTDARTLSRQSHGPQQGRVRQLQWRGHSIKSRSGPSAAIRR